MIYEVLLTAFFGVATVGGGSALFMRGFFTGFGRLMRSLVLAVIMIPILISISVSGVLSHGGFGAHSSGFAGVTAPTGVAAAAEDAASAAAAAAEESARSARWESNSDYSYANGHRYAHEADEWRSQRAAESARFAAQQRDQAEAQGKSGGEPHKSPWQ